MRKTMRTGAYLGVGILTSCLIFVTSGCNQPLAMKAPMTAVPVEAATVIAKEIRVSYEFNGRVSATNNVDIRPRVTGYVDRIAFREGQTVHQGDLLYMIDPRPYKDAVDSAKANLERERAAADFAKIQSDRAQSLRESDAISQEEFQNRGSDLSQNNARVKAAEAALATAQLNLSFTQVRSPIDGRTSRTQLTRGNLAQADQTILTTVVSEDPVWVFFDCDEQNYLRLQEYARRGGGISANNPVRVALANEVGFPHVGRVDFLDNATRNVQRLLAEVRRVRESDA